MYVRDTKFVVAVGYINRVQTEGPAAPKNLVQSLKFGEDCKIATVKRL